MKALDAIKPEGSIKAVPTRTAAKKTAWNKRRLRQFSLSILFIAVLAGGWVYPWLGYFIPVCMVAGIGIALRRGRKWCGTFCPRGAFYDALVKPFSPGKKIPGLFKGLPMRIGVLAFLMGMLTFQIITRWPDPVSIGRFFVILLTVTTGIGLLLAYAYRERTWCYICPIGTLSKWVGGSKRPVRIEASACVNCTLCTKTCPVEIRPSEFRKEGAVLDPDCLKCNTCVSTCPKRALIG